MPMTVMAPVVAVYAAGWLLAVATAEFPASGCGEVEVAVREGRALSAADVEPLAPACLRLVRNLVFARHGRSFNSPDLRRYLASQSWYRESPQFRMDLLSAIDKRNIALLTTREKEAESGGVKQAPPAPAVAAPARAGKEPFAVIRTFRIGRGDGALGFEPADGEGGSMDVGPSLTVNEDGDIVIVDSVNSRVLIFNEQAEQRAVIRSPWTTYGESSASLLKNREVLVEWSSDPSLVVRNDIAGKPLARAEEYIGPLVTQLQDGSLLFERDSGAKERYERRSLDFKMIETLSEVPAELGKRDSWVRDYLKITTPSGCYLFDKVLAPMAWELRDDKLLLRGSGEIGFADLHSRSATLYELPSSYGEDVYGPAVGRVDRALYSLVRRAKTFELVRWKLEELPSQTYTAPAATIPPQIDPIPTQTATVAQELEVVFRAHNAAGRRVTVNVENLPQGAQFESDYGRGDSLIAWKPRTDQVGPHDVTIVATDRKCGRTTLTFRITVQ